MQGSFFHPQTADFSLAPEKLEDMIFNYLGGNTSLCEEFLGINMVIELVK